MHSKVRVQLVLSLVDSKTRPRVAKLLVKMYRSTDFVPADLVDEADLFNSGGQIRFAYGDGSLHGAFSWVDVERLQFLSNYAAASRYKCFACLAEPEHFGDTVGALEYVEHELVWEIQERGFGFGFSVRFRAVAALAFGMENHSEIIQEQSGDAVT